MKTFMIRDYLQRDEIEVSLDICKSIIHVIRLYVFTVFYSFEWTNNVFFLSALIVQGTTWFWNKTKCPIVRLFFQVKFLTCVCE